MKDIEIIQTKIYEIRNQYVMLDRDLAAIYGVETKVLNQAVKRNIERFPSDFMFQVNKDELESLRSQFVTSKRGGNRYYPYAFTELGVAMLSSVLNSDTAIAANINIMRAFVESRRYAKIAAQNYNELRKEVDEIKNSIEMILVNQDDINNDYDERLNAISIAIAELQNDNRKNNPRRMIGYRPSDN